MLYFDVPTTFYLGGVAMVVAVSVPFVTRSVVPQQTMAAVVDDVSVRRGRRRSWVNGRTALLGLLVLGMALSEGAGNDWIGVAVVDGYPVSVPTATTALAVFLIAMTGTRWVGPVMVDRFGRARTLTGVLCCGLVGLGLLIFGQLLVMAMVGAALWGIGTTLGMPIGLSVASDDHDSTGSVTTVTSIGYLAFLSGPPLTGSWPTVSVRCTRSC